MKQKKKILFVAYGGGHVNMILPVLEALRARGDVALSVLGLTTAAPVLRRAGFDCLGFADLVEAGDAAALAHGRALAAGVQSDLVARAETEAYMGLSYADLEAEHGAEQAAAMYAAGGRHVFLPLRTLGRLIGRLQPDLVVATNAPRAERAAIMAARAAGVPALCLLDLYPAADGGWLKDAAFADRVCVLNAQAGARLAASGRPPGHIAVTGNPAFDRHYLYQAPARAPGAAPVLGLASNILPQPPAGQTDGQLQRAVFERLRALCARRGYTFTLRQHPNETRWTDLGLAHDGSSQPLDAWLAGLDMLVTFPSTIALEAQIHGVRVGLLDMTSLSAACDYLFDGHTEAFATLEQLDAITLARGAAGAARASGSATARVCAVIAELIDLKEHVSD